jgi:hypothetical protein
VAGLKGRFEEEAAADAQPTKPILGWEEAKLQQ